MTVTHDPGALWKPLSEHESQPKITPTQLILHTIVGSAAGAWRMFEENSQLESHWIVPFEGARWQLMDLRRQADANYRANRRPDGTGALSVETEDRGPATVQDTPWSPHQCDQIVELGVFACVTFDIPARLCPSPSAPGIGYHTLFGAPSEWTPVSKSCPGRARIAQVPELIARIAAGVSGAPAPVPEEEDPMDPRNRFLWYYHVARDLHFRVDGNTYTPLTKGELAHDKWRYGKDIPIVRLNSEQEYKDAIGNKLNTQKLNEMTGAMVVK